MRMDFLQKNKFFSYFCIFMLILGIFPIVGEAGISVDDSLMDMGMALPVGGGSEEVDLNICPEGANVVAVFLTAWKKEDFRTMYELLDEESRVDYSFEEAKLDFMFLEFKPYKISSIRKAGDDFEFILSYGDWKDGDKETKKIIISGRTFKIVMYTRGSPFKESIVNYF